MQQTDEDEWAETVGTERSPASSHHTPADIAFICGPSDVSGGSAHPDATHTRTQGQICGVFKRELTHIYAVVGEEGGRKQPKISPLYAY